jgi:hypothetical protein
MELTCTRCFELVCESIPGTLASARTNSELARGAVLTPYLAHGAGSVLQLTALIREASKEDGEISKLALSSIIVSACTTGFSAATISFK